MLLLQVSRAYPWIAANHVYICWICTIIWHVTTVHNVIESFMHDSIRVHGLGNVSSNGRKGPIIYLHGYSSMLGLDDIPTDCVPSPIPRLYAGIEIFNYVVAYYHHVAAAVF